MWGGRLLVPIAEIGIDILSVGLSENMLSICRSKVEERKLGDHVHP